MKIAFVHYHLKTGGVTTVLKQQLAALAQDCETMVFTGVPPEKAWPADIVHIPELAYSNVHQKEPDPGAVAQIIRREIHSRFKGPCDVLHVHNPTLAKNRYFLKILNALQQSGVKLLLQIHDFAEDGRPQAYFSDAYPADCHYAVINSRDYEALLRAGLCKKGLHLLANSVNPRPFEGTSKAIRPVAVYPVRAIRRKNVGEAILLSLFFRAGEPLSITLPPNSPQDIQSYRAWKLFVSDHHLRVAFDSGVHHEFETMVGSAGFLITTSITEGFGFSFLEPWLFEKLLWGRKLPDICRDFERHGLDLEHLYTRLQVPVDWIGFRQFYQKWRLCVLNTCAVFNFPMTETLVQKSFDAITRDATIDFGLLDEASQKRVILRLISNQTDSAKLTLLNSFLQGPAGVPDAAGLIETNKQAIEKNYGPAIYRQKLLEIYRRVSRSQVNQKIDKQVLVAEFLDLEKFSLLKWRAYGD